ncbi:hypothetical protein evm_014258 [Chilo suppressalis]|nr:hypothetical protein evm_014258 [Chilo suppressalis]
MFRTYQRKTDGPPWSKETLYQAVDAVKSGLSGYEAAKTYNIPRKTIMDHVTGRRRQKSSKQGRPLALSAETEKELADCLHVMERNGFGLCRKEVLELVGDFVNKNNINTPFANGHPVFPSVVGSNPSQKISYEDLLIQSTTPSQTGKVKRKNVKISASAELITHLDVIQRLKQKEENKANKKREKEEKRKKREEKKKAVFSKQNEKKINEKGKKSDVKSKNIKEEHDDLIRLLQNIRTVNLVIENWECTTSKRLLMLKGSMEIHKYMDNFPALKCSDGYRLSAAEVLLTNLHNKENYFQRGLPLGPQLFAVSPDEDNITECFLIINDTMYNIDSPLKAFDIFFKLFHALNCCYPKQTERELQHNVPNHFQSPNTTILCENNVINVPSLKSPHHVIQIDSRDDFDVIKFNCNLTKHATDFVAKLYSKPGLLRNHVVDVIKDVTSFLSETFAPSNWSKIKKALKLSQLKPDVVYAIKNIFRTIASPFSELSSEHLRMKYFQSTGDYILPETYIIGSRVERKVTGGVVKGKMQNCQKWKTIKSQFYSQSDIVIPIIIYYDDWEPNNALGPHSEKIGCVCANLPALPEECQSKLENIFEVLIFNADDRKKYGNKKTFRPLVEELKYLETERILIKTPQGEKKVHFPTVLLIGDNLGVNGMCGFVECFSATYMCRFCKATKQMTESMIVEDSACLRDSVNYANDVTLNDFRKAGIKEEFVFKEVKSLRFDIPNAFAVDCMHDGPEGVAHYTMIPILNHLLDLDPLSLETLKCRMYMFDYDQDVNNRPPSVTRENLNKKKLKMTASEMTVFVRYFGLFVGDMISEDDEYWHMYLHLHDMFNIFQCVFFNLTVDIVPILQNIVSEYNYLNMKLTGEPLKPKHHFLLHYPRLFLINGPFAPISSMRNEGKHKELKSYTNVCMSRRNVLCSLAVKRQIAHCYRFILGETILPKIVIGSGNF